MLEADLLFAFQEKEVTVPLIYDGTVIAARGFLNEQGTTAELDGLNLQLAATVLFLPKSAAASLQLHHPIIVGALGADSAEGGRRFTILKREPVDDGAITAIALGDSLETTGHRVPRHYDGSWKYDGTHQYDGAQ